MKHTTALLATFIIAAGADGATFKVVNANDSGAGSLRWAIEQANATPGRDTISGSSLVIRVSSGLPPITEAADFNSVTIDGSGAGNADGLTIRAADANINYVQVRNFGGDGIVVAGDHNDVSFVSVTNVRNGMIVSGDNNMLMGAEITKNRENGIWVTSTASGNTLGHLMMMIMCPAVPTGLYINHNGVAGVRIDGAGNTVEENVIEANGDGILVTAAGNTVINSSFTGNGRNGATLLAPVRFSHNAGGCNAGSFVAGALVAPPVINVATADVNAGTVSGVFHGDPNRVYTLQLLSDVPSATCPQGLLAFVGMKRVTTDGKGEAAFTTAFSPLTTAVAAIAVGADGQVSRLSSRAAVAAIGENRSDLAIAMTGPATTLPGQEITHTIRLTNNGPAAINGAFIRIPATAGAVTVGAVGEADVSSCYLASEAAYCSIGPLAAGESATILHTVKVWLGTVTVRATTGHIDTYRLVDPNPSNDSISASLSVTGAPAGRHRPSGH